MGCIPLLPLPLRPLRSLREDSPVAVVLHAAATTSHPVAASMPPWTRSMHLNKSVIRRHYTKPTINLQARISSSANLRGFSLIHVWETTGTTSKNNSDHPGATAPGLKNAVRECALVAKQSGRVSAKRERRSSPKVPCTAKMKSCFR